jgi:hypothetical protein
MGCGVVVVGAVTSALAVGATVADDPQAPMTTVTANPIAGSKVRPRRWRLIGTRALLDCLQGPGSVAAKQPSRHGQARRVFARRTRADESTHREKSDVRVLAPAWMGLQAVGNAPLRR